MRTAALLPGLFVLTLSAHATAQDTTKLDLPVRGELRIDNPGLIDRCAGLLAVNQIARQADVLVGFENARGCQMATRALKADIAPEALTGMSARQALDRLMTLMPGFSWRAIGGVAVVRPDTAWDDPADVLNLPTAAFSATDRSLNELLHTALRLVSPSAFYPHEDVPHSGRAIDAPVSVRFEGGTLLHALNALVTAHHAAEWNLVYRAGDRGAIALESLSLDGGGVIAPVKLPQTRVGSARKTQ
jgi:hypothetical protein